MTLATASAVLRELRDTGPATRFELAAALDQNQTSLWFTLRVLLDGGIVEPCGRRGQALVYRLAPPGTPPSPKPYQREGRPHAERYAPITSK